MAYSSGTQLSSESLRARACAEAPIIIRETFGLNYDPFAPGSAAVLAEPVKAAFAQITGELGRGARAIVITGAPGAGKTLLLSLIQDSYSGQGRSVSRVDLAALFPAALDHGPDLLLLDEADGADPLALNAALSEHRETPRTIVLASRPEAAVRLSSELCAVVIHLTPLTRAQALDFIIERVTKAGRRDLFTPVALDRLIEAGAGSPQALRAMAGMAMFLAAYSQASRIDASHVEEAVRSQGGFLPEEARSDTVAESRERQSMADETETLRLKALADQTETVLLRAFADGTETVPSKAEAAAEEPAAEGRAAEAPPAGEPVAEVPGLSSSLLGAVVGLRPESEPPAARAFPRHRKLAAAAVLLAALPISGSVLFGTEDHRAAHVTLASVTPPTIIRAPRRIAAEGLSTLDRVAKAVLPGRVVLALVPLGSLQSVSIEPLDKRAVPVPQPARRTVAALPSPLAKPTPPPSATSVAGSQTMIATVPVPPPVVERVTAPRAALPPRYMTANAMALALVDISEQAGFGDDDEFVAFRACVFRRVSPGAAEQTAFWRAVEVCLH